MIMFARLATLLPLVDAPPHKQIFVMKRMHDLLEKARNMSSSKDALAVKLGRNFKRSGMFSY